MVASPSVNTMPAVSGAARMVFRLLRCGVRSPVSRRLIVDSPTLAALARSGGDQFSMARAARHLFRRYDHGVLPTGAEALFPRRGAELDAGTDGGVAVDEDNAGGLQGGSEGGQCADVRSVLAALEF